MPRKNMMTCETLSDVRINPFLCPTKFFPQKKIAAKKVLKHRPFCPVEHGTCHGLQHLHFQGVMPCCSFQGGWQVTFFLTLPEFPKELWTEYTRRSSSHHQIN